MLGDSKNVPTSDSTKKDIQPTNMDYYYYMDRFFEKESECMEKLSKLFKDWRVWIINAIKWVPMWYLTEETWYKLPPIWTSVYWWGRVPNLYDLNEVSKLEHGEWYWEDDVYQIRSKCDRYTIVYLNWLKNISPEDLEQLSHTRIYRLELNWLKTITNEQLKALKDAHPVTLEWIDSLSDNQLEILSESVESFLNCYFGKLTLSKEQQEKYRIFWGRVFKKSETIENNWMLLDFKSNKVYQYDWLITLQQYRIKDWYEEKVMDFFENPSQKQISA